MFSLLLHSPIQENQKCLTVLVLFFAIYRAKAQQRVHARPVEWNQHRTFHYQRLQGSGTLCMTVGTHPTTTLPVSPPFPCTGDSNMCHIVHRSTCFFLFCSTEFYHLDQFHSAIRVFDFFK